MEYHKDRSPKQLAKNILSAPIIYSMIIPTVFLDAFVELYQQTCFRLYGIPLNARTKYIKIDRHKLKYLNTLEKINCVYCGYSNGVFNYVSKIAGDTEKHWCGIRHKETENFMPAKHQKNFIAYNDENAYKNYKKHLQQ